MAASITYGNDPNVVKIQIAIELLKQKYPKFVISVRRGLDGDYVEFLFEGVARWKAANTFIAVSNPKEIALAIERQLIKFPPKRNVADKLKAVKESIPKSWADKWAEEHKV